MVRLGGVGEKKNEKKCILKNKKLSVKIRELY